MSTLIRSRSRGHRLHLLVAAAVAVGAILPGAGPPPVAASVPTTSALVPVGPVRVADTRRQQCGCTRLDPATLRIGIADRAGIPADAIAAAITVTALRTPAPGFVTVSPAGLSRPDVSTANTRPDRIVANAAIVPLGADGAIDLYSSEPGEIVVDVMAVFVPATSARAGRYRPSAGIRLLDTRTASPPSGMLPVGGSLRVPLPAGVDEDATAVVVNVTSVRATAWGHLSARPTGAEAVTTSFLNPDGSGAPVAGATIVPVGPHGFDIDSAAGGHLVVDLLGWFTGPNAEASTSGLFVPSTPRRLLDTREGDERVNADGGLEIAPPVTDAAALVTNVTVVRPDRRGFVTAHAAGRRVPGTSTVNPAFWNHTVANFAITRMSDRGVAYRASVGVDLAVDLTGWFTGEPAEATDPPPTNAASPARVLLVGDSTLDALDAYPWTQAALEGFEGLVDAASCRRLLRPSCRSDKTGLTPNTAVQAIESAPGALDIVVVKAGYNDWFSDFPAEFDAVVRAARAKGAHTVLWMTYNERVSRVTAQRAYRENNVDLRRLAPLPDYSDVHLADWFAYSDARQDWFYDGTHLTPSGTWALADYISRWIAAIEHRPCPRPWTLGGTVSDPCRSPDDGPPVPDPQSLY